MNYYNIEAVIPGDFDGDGGMDVLVVTIPEDPEDIQNMQVPAASLWLILRQKFVWDKPNLPHRTTFEFGGH